MSDFCAGVNVKPMWLKDDLTWSSLNHVVTLTGCVCCPWLVHCLLDLCYVILPNISAIVFHIMGCMNFLNVSFPTLGRQALAH